MSIFGLGLKKKAKRLQPETATEAQMHVRNRTQWIEEQQALEQVLKQLPRGVNMRSIQPRQAGNRFAARYDTNGGYGKEYYGQTLSDALYRLLTEDERLIGRISHLYVYNLQTTKEIDL